MRVKEIIVWLRRWFWRTSVGEWLMVKLFGICVNEEDLKNLYYYGGSMDWDELNRILERKR